VTASRAEPGALRAALAAAALAGAAGCTGPVTVPEGSVLEPAAGSRAVVPRDADLAAARLAEAALAVPARGAAGEEAARERLRAALAGLEAAVEEPGDAPAGASSPPADGRARVARLVPLGRDLAHATLADERERRRASRELLGDDRVDPALEERLRREVRDDPLRLARARDRDHAEKLFAYHFNAVSEPLGKSLLTGFILAPYHLATRAVHYVAGAFEGPGMDVPERQALQHRRRFLRRHPDAPEAPALRRETQAQERERQQLLRDRELDAASSALAGGRSRRAALLARRAVGRDPEHERSQRLLAAAEAEVARRARRLEGSLRPRPEGLRDVELGPDLARRAAEALWSDGVRAERALAALARADRTGALRDEVAYARATLQMEAGYEDASWERLGDLAARDRRSSNMARHAAVLRGNPWQDPYRAFLEARAAGRRRAAAHELLGRWSEGPRYRNLPAPLAYLIDLPSVVRTAVLTPVRALLSLGRERPDFQGPAAALAYRYLARHPEGRHAREVLAWLQEYEEDRGHWDAALRLADFRPAFDPEHRSELVERAAERRMAVADRLDRRDQRGTVLRSVVREFPDSEAGHRAGLRVRRELEEAAPQHIRMTRGFLEENPGVAGPEGLGLRMELLDGRLRNGEVHPEGITFLGGRQIEVALMPETGDEDDEPVRTRRRIAADRLARTVALLDETATRNARVDPDDSVAPDPRRDLYFERARLELTDRSDPRPTAESTYVFRGVRERYGMVRGRESILPFDLVLQGSLEDLSLGAFPRWRRPEETPDAFLYR